MSIMLTKDDWVKVTLILLLLSACAGQDHQPSQGEEGHGDGGGRRRHHDSNANKIAAQNLTLNSFFPSLVLTSVTRFFDPEKREKGVKKRLDERRKKDFCAKNPLKKREKQKKVKKPRFIAFLLTIFPKISGLQNFFC